MESIAAWACTADRKDFITQSAVHVLTKLATCALGKAEANFIIFSSCVVDWSMDALIKDKKNSCQSSFR